MQLYFYVYISAYVAFILRSMKVFNNAYNIAYAYESYHRKEIHHIAEKCTLAYIQSSCKIQASVSALGSQPRKHSSENANPTVFKNKRKNHGIKTVKSHWHCQSRG